MTRSHQIMFRMSSSCWFQNLIEKLVRQRNSDDGFLLLLDARDTRNDWSRKSSGVLCRRS